MMMILFTTAWMLSSMFMFLNHPLSFGFVLLLQTIIVSLLSGMMNFNYWFSYIIFLVMVGGMLVLFLYMTSVASNEKFKFSSKLMALFTSFVLLTFIMILTDHYFLSEVMHTNDLINQNLKYKNELSMNKYMNWPSSSIMYLVISYLLLTLIAVVKITNIKSGPLRQKF
uniref:NADH dehydrogenase subunit 6 n=1 Tax=Trachylophus sinensis TaxID=1261036 RepID=UPI00226CDEE9|nr:NADH dehydrogenase subunit 6 [Trachylophus sinensis]UZC33507.1 NADH dehydrogenase subunit 6 [Trachylophus sinensis]